ncbi:MAG: 3-deoxy-8-phosphooctulonate synthase [Thermodesulfobacteriota bacterium]|nr:3-deoxy-8-phosphooctulonate synthase [Thermodesulfobacteriota bacterium]
MKTVEINTLPGDEIIRVGPDQPLLLLAGPCVLESGEMAWEIAREMKTICRRLGISYVFKASFDKANRTSLDSFRGPGLEKGLRQLGRIREEVGVAVVSDIHEPRHVEMATEYLDIVQIPAFLCRQTDLLVAAAKSGKTVNLKKGQFVSPWDMEHAVNKLRAAGCERILLTERGASFGYNNLVVDMRSLPVMRSLGCPVIYDATHSVQLPGGMGGSSGGQREFIPPLTRAAMAAGIDGLFMEMHPNPEKALCDGPNSWPLDQVETLLKQLLKVRAAVHGV